MRRTILRKKLLLPLSLLCLALPLIAQYEDSDAVETAAGLAAMGGCAIFVLLALVINILIIIWVYRDAKARGMDNAALWLVLVLIFGLLGLIIYLIVRPKGVTAPCNNCGKKRMEGLTVCPTCGNP